MKYFHRNAWLLGFFVFSLMALMFTRAQESESPIPEKSDTTITEKWDLIKKNNEEMIQDLTKIEEDLNFARLRLAQRRR